MEKERVSNPETLARWAKMFEDEGFERRDRGIEHAVILENKKLRVALFDYGWPNTNQRGHVLAEHQENFDKWSKAYYWGELPTSVIEASAILRDMELIQHEDEIEFGNSFGHIRRTF